MMRPALVAVFVALILLGPAAGQESPFGMPKPMGGPIVDRSGRILTGLDAHPVPSPWTSAFDFGLSGSQGNTDTLKRQHLLLLTMKSSAQNQKFWTMLEET